MPDTSKHNAWLTKLSIGIFVALFFFCASATELPTFEEIAVIRAKAHQDRYKTYILDKLKVHSFVQEKRGLCFDFIGDSDGLYQSMFNSGPIMVDLSNCGEESDFIDGRIKALKILLAREHQEGLSQEQIDNAIEEINIIFAGKIYDPEIKEQ